MQWPGCCDAHLVTRLSLCMGSSAVQALGVRHVGACLMLFVEYDRVDANRHCHYVQRSIGWCVCVCVCDTIEAGLQ